MKYFVFLTLFAFSTSIKGQMYNDSPFNAQVANPKYNKSKGPKVLIDAGHHNFIVELGLAKPLIDVANLDGYQVVIDSMQFTKEYLSNYKLVIILPAMPFTFGSKKQITTEITFSTDELNALHEWVSNGGRLLMFSEHAPIDKSMTPLFNKFGIQLSIGIVSDSLYCDSAIKISSYQTLLKFTRTNGLLNIEHPITKGENANEHISNIVTYGGSGLTGEGYANIFKLSSSAFIKKWSGSLPFSTANSQCLAGKIGNGKVVALGDCNGFTAMYIKSGESKFSAGMQVPGYDWKQFALNTLHWLSK